MDFYESDHHQPPSEMQVEALLGWYVLNYTAICLSSQNRSICKAFRHIMPYSAQVYKADRLRKAVDVLGLQIVPDSLLPDTTFSLSAKDGRIVCLRTDPMGAVEHVGVPLFSDMMRLLQPSPVYDFLEYAVLNWKYKVNPNQLYLSKVIFKTGSWETLLRNRLNECECFIENREDKLYIVTWKRDDKEIAIVGIPIEYELLNNDTRRNMERAFIRDLGNSSPSVAKPNPAVVSEESLSIYGTGGLFVIPGRSYIIDLLNQNVYYKLTTVYETADTVINKKPVTIEGSLSAAFVVCRFYPFCNTGEAAFCALLFSRLLSTTLCSRMKKPSSAPLAISCHQLSFRPLRGMIFWMVARIMTPKKVPITLPTPPVSSVPPIMEAAMASISLRKAMLDG